MVDFRVSFQQVESSDDLIHASESGLSKVFTNILGQHPEKVYQVIGFSHETLSQLGVLRCDTYGASIEMAFSHHYAAQYYQGTCCEAKFLGTQHSNHDYILGSFNLSVSLQHNLSSKVIHHKRLLSLCQPKFKRKTGVLY